MAKVKNITNDVLSLFRADAPPVSPGDVVTVRDENFVGRAWPTSTWEVVEPPTLDGYVDQSTEDAILWAEPEDEGDPLPEPAFNPSTHTVEEVIAYLSESDATERDRVMAAETAVKARKGITEWSDR